VAQLGRGGGEPSFAPPPSIDSSMINIAGPSFIKFCQLRKMHQIFSLALRASFLKEFLTIFLFLI